MTNPLKYYLDTISKRELDESELTYLFNNASLEILQELYQKSSGLNQFMLNILIHNKICALVFGEKAEKRTYDA